MTRERETGDLASSRRTGANTWDELFELLRAVDLPGDHIAERPLNVPAHPAGVFHDEEAPPDGRMAEDALLGAEGQMRPRS